MQQPTEGTRADTDAQSLDQAEEHHPTGKQYVQVAVVLGVLTAMEVSASFIEIGGAFLPTLIVLMLIKFVLVAGWFMHLRFDTRLYSRFMLAGLGLAGTIYAVVLLNLFLST